MSKENQLKVADALERAIAQGVTQRKGLFTEGTGDTTKLCVTEAALAGNGLPPIENGCTNYLLFEQIFEVRPGEFFGRNDRKDDSWPFSRFLSELRSDGPGEFDAA